jgi:hypothetical protein
MSTDLQEDTQALYLAILLVQLSDEALQLQGLLLGALLLGIHGLLAGLLISLLRCALATSTVCKERKGRNTLITRLSDAN